jgi:hypothetical protein
MRSEISAFDCADQLERLDAREHGQRDFGTNPADADQPLEQLLLQQRGEAVQDQCFFTDVGVDAQRSLGSRVAEAVERGEGHEHVVPHTVDVDDEAIGMLFENPPAQMGDHRVVLGRSALVVGRSSHQHPTTSGTRRTTIIARDDRCASSWLCSSRA